MRRIYNHTTNPLALPLIGKTETFYKEYEADENGRYGDVIKKREEPVGESTLFIKGTHHKKLVSAPEFEEVTEADFEKLQKGALFKNLVDSNQIRVEKI